MGSFDNVRYSAPCPTCGTEVTDWQTKDLDCDFTTVEPHDVRYFYSGCNHCHTWIEVSVQVEKVITKMILTTRYTKNIVGEEAKMLDPIVIVPGPLV